MILDVITNSERLSKLHPGFQAAFEFLKRPDIEQLADGRQEIDGTRLYAIVIRGQGKGQQGAKLECHRRYIDIQCSLTESDVIGWKQISACQNPAQAYDETKDLQFFTDTPDSWVAVPQRSFGIYFPEDAHAPMGTEGPIHKIVVKVAVDW